MMRIFRLFLFVLSFFTFFPFSLSLSTSSVRTFFFLLLFSKLCLWVSVFVIERKKRDIKLSTKN